MKKIFILAAIIATSGCATQTFNLQPGASAEPVTDSMQLFFVGGLGQTQETNAAELCGGAANVAKVEAHMTFIDGLLGGLSYGIFTPRHARVYCVAQ